MGGGSQTSRWCGRGATACLAAIFLSAASVAFGQITVEGVGGANAAVSPNGNWQLRIPEMGWSFSGGVGASLYYATPESGKDKLGEYRQVTFRYPAPGTVHISSMRLYTARPVAIFSTTWEGDTPNMAPFPVITQYPALQHLSFNGMFAQEDFANVVPDSATAWFDGTGKTWVISAATNFMTAETARNSSDAIEGRISGQIPTLPAGFTHETILTWGHGINKTLVAWGTALTDKSGKGRPGNGVDTLLSHLSYWTDNGAFYYYNPGELPYAESLKAIRAELAGKGIRLGSLQLDSWWYPKGPDNSWFSRSGIWTYTAAPNLFRGELAEFRREVGIPLTTHARWIDAASPYRTEYVMSGDVSIDPKYWEKTATYLKASGVGTYEQDWLGLAAHTDFNLKDPDAFLDNMASAMALRGLTIQYCMANPNHFLASSKYSNVTSIRTSQDRFGRERWSHFLYSSRLATAVGAWPFTDVFMSSERDNLLLATLSAGPLGIGDELGKINPENLLMSVRKDGMIVKPDVAVLPTDDTILADAKGVDVPMQAAAWTDFNGLRANYIFGYTRGANSMLTIDPAKYGISGEAWLYDVLKGEGRLIAPRATWTTDLGADVGYFLLTAVGKSGLALTGDKELFVTMGRKRISEASDDGVVDVTVEFSVGETMRSLSGYSPRPVNVSAVNGRLSSPVWTASTQTFTVNVRPEAGSRTARFRLSQAGHVTPPPGGGACAPRCAVPPGNGPVR